MKIALIGPTGNVGSRLLAEFLRRGHEVTGIARHPEGLSSQPHLTVKRGMPTMKMASQRFCPATTR